MDRTKKHFTRLVTLRAAKEINYEDLHRSFEELVEDLEELSDGPALPEPNAIVVVREDRTKCRFYFLIDPLGLKITAFVELGLQ